MRLRPMQRRSVQLAVGVAAVAALLLSLATPAHAASVSAGCTTTAGDGELRRLEAWAYYSPQGATDLWYQTDYILSGDHTGDQSNVNFYVFDGGVLVYYYFSPDSLAVGILYSTGMNVATTAANGEYIQYSAIFDRWLAPDPKCIARTQTI